MKKNMMNWKKKFLTQSLFFQPYIEEVDTAEQRLLNYTNDIISEDDDNEGNNLDNPVDRGIESVDVAVFSIRKSLQVLQKACIKIVGRAIYTYLFFSYTYTLLYCCKIKSYCAGLHKLCARL